MSTVKERYHLHNTPDTKAVFKENPQQFLAGVEYEIEDIKDLSGLFDFNRFQVKEDGSLRNNGHEIITAPNTFSGCLEDFNIIHDTISYGDKAFSHRTSIHVHINVATLEKAQLKQLILLYALTEPLFFNFVGKEREGSIFCVPLSYTYLPSLYKKSSDSLVASWHKYTAFNILPAQTQGSVEFRHLYGTNNKEVFETWLSSIKSLYDFVVNTPKFNIIKELNNVPQLVQRVVPKLLEKGDISMLSNTILDVKLAGI